MVGSSGQALPREVLAPTLSCFSPQWVRQRCDTPFLPGRSHQPAYHVLGGPWASHVRFVPLGAGWVGSEWGAAPCSVWFVSFLGPCLSAHLVPHPPEALPPARTCPLLKGWPLVLTWCMDLWSFPLQNKDCSGLPGPLPPAACLGVGRASR